MKKRYIIEWIILLGALIIAIPFIMVKYSQDGDELLWFFRITIRYIAPTAIILLTTSQVVRANLTKRRNHRKSI